MGLKNKFIVKNNTQIERCYNSKTKDKIINGNKRNFLSQSKQNRFKKYKKVWLTLTLIVCGVGLILFFSNGGPDEVKFSKLDKIQAYVYYSRGSRDAEKKEQYIFKVDDPIQVKIDFKDMNDGDVVIVSLIKLGSDEVKYSVKVPVDSGEGNRFVALSPLVRKESSKYKIEVSTEIEEQIVILEEIEFEII